MSIPKSYTREAPRFVLAEQGERFRQGYAAYYRDQTVAEALALVPDHALTPAALDFCRGHAYAEMEVERNHGPNGVFLLPMDPPPAALPPQPNLRVWVGLDDSGNGWVLAHDGDRGAPSPPYKANIHLCFANEMDGMSRMVEDLPFPGGEHRPRVAGLYLWEGVFRYEGSGEDAEPIMDGTWTRLQKVGL